MTPLTREATAYQMIKQRIIDAEFEPNSLISENELAASLNMSRTPIRSALSQLTIEGFVKTHRNKGVQILDIPLHDIADMFEVLTALQQQLIGLAAVKDLAFDLAALQNHLEKQKLAAEEKNFKMYYTHTLLFTRTILAAASNEKMLEIIDSYTDKILAKFIANRRYKNNSKPGQTHQSQEKLYAALAERDFTKAAQQVDYYYKIMKDYAFNQEVT